MRHIFRTIAIACMLFYGISVDTLHAQDAEAGTQSILNFGASARALGMGRAYVALADDPSAVFWNPAGLEFVPRLSLSLFHAPLYEGASYDFVGFVYPTLQFGTIGIGYARLGIGDVPVVNESNIREGAATFEYSELYISYAKNLPYHITGGLSFKIDRQSFSYQNLATGGIGLDVGFMYSVPFESNFFRNLRLGFQYQNFLKPELKLGAETEKLPRLLRLGLAKKLNLGVNGKITVLLDYSKSQFESARLHMGSEYKYKEFGSLRLGMDKSNLAFGAGAKYSFVQIDYSFGNLSYQGEFPATHRFSITFNLGKSRDELVLIAEEKRKKREKELVERAREEERQRFIADHLSKGENLLKESKFFDAQAEFQAVISEDPFNKIAKARLDSVNALIQKELERRQQQAIASAVDKELAKENKRYVEFHFEKGQVYLQNKQYTDALLEFNLALERSPEDPLLQEAIATTKRRLNEEVKTLVTQARQQFNTGNYSEALRILSEALVLAPEDPQLKEEINALANRIKVQQYVQEALQYYDLGEYQRALGRFEEALKLDPSNTTIRQYLERTRRGLGAVKETMDPESERQYIIGTELFLAGRYEEALEVWKKLAEKYPYNKKIQDAISNAEDRIRRTKERK